MRDTVECSREPACDGDHHGWGCPLADPRGDVLRGLMDPLDNPLLDQSRWGILQFLLAADESDR